MTPRRFGGISFCGGLTLVFIGLKLSRAIDWSWVWVLCPMWMPFLLILILSIVIVVVDECDKRFGR